MWKNAEEAVIVLRTRGGSMKKTNIVLGIVAAAVMLSSCSKGNETGVTTQTGTDKKC